MSGLHFGLTLSLSRRVNGRPFSPSSLFSNGEQGVLYDISDLSTMFQDAAGTVPVTADGDPVGLVLDKHSWGGKTLEQVLADQPELWTGGTSAGTAGYATFDAGTGYWTVNRDASGSGNVQAFSPVAGKTYRIDLDFSPLGTGTYHYINNTQAGGSAFVTPFSSPGHLTYFYRATNGGTVSFGNPANGCSWGFKVSSIKEIPGNHAAQSSTSKRRAFKTDGSLYWLLDDGVDDDLPVTLPDLGSNCTVAYADETGVHILTDQTISGSYNLPTTGGKLYACIIVDRALTSGETAMVTAWLEGKAGL
jgi:hypothetical protein